MTDKQRLLKIIADSGLRKKYIAEQLGLTTYGFQKKVENKNQFKAEEIKILCKVLKISSLKEKEEIFFGEIVDETSTIKKEGIN